MGGQRGFRHGPPGGGSLAGPTDNKNRMAGAGSERSDAASPHGRSGSELQETGCGSLSIRDARARFHIRLGVDQSPRPRGSGRPASSRPTSPVGPALPTGGGCAGLSPRPRPSPGNGRGAGTRPPGTRASLGLELSRRGRPGSRPLRPTLGRGLPARSPPAARLPQEGHGRRGPPLRPIPEGQTWGPLPGRADPARERRAAAAGPAATAATSALPARRLARPRPLRPFPRPAPRAPHPPRARPALLLNLLAASPHRPSPHAREAGAAPGPAGGRPPLLQPQAAARAPGEREAPPLPPARPPATRRGPGSARRPRRRSERRASQSCPWPVRSSPARPQPQPQPQPLRRRFLLPFPLFPSPSLRREPSLANQHLLLEITEN